MQAPAPSSVTASSLPLVTLQKAAQAEAQLNLIFNDLQREQKAIVSAPSPRHDVTEALRGFRFTDPAAISIGFICAWALAISVKAAFFSHYGPSRVLEDGFLKISESMLIGFCVIAWFAHKGHYRMRMPFWTETKHIVETMGFAMLVDIFFRFVAKQDFSRLWMISGWVFATLGVIGFRSLWRRHKGRQGTWNVATLLVGRGEAAEEARRALASEPRLGFDIKAQIDNLPVALARAGHSWQTLCAMHEADYVIIALDGADLMHAEQAFAQLMRDGIPFSVSPPMHNAPVLGMVPQYFFNHDVMLLTHNHGLNQMLPRFMKRVFDVVVASTALLALSPLLMAAAFVVKMDGGPALFGHKRLGREGKSFSCLKFRSMVPDSDAALKKHLEENAEARAEWQRNHKLRDDPRVTKIGKFLRRSSIDELPQLLNVLKGDMSIVGPRPIIVAETEKYNNDISHYYRVRPGITGLWQVSGRNDVSYAQRVQMDSWYVRNWSLWHDIAIICKTFPVVLNRIGAY